jgi:hypothetical protein
MHDTPEPHEPERDPRTGLFKGSKSYGGRVDEKHWSRSRGDRNEEALEYYRERSHAPGVAEGGGPRNFYCMECDGVVPHDHVDPTCPHCDATLAGQAKRYFNWVEIDQPPASDARALLPLFAIALVIVLALVGALWWLVRWLS